MCRRDREGARERVTWYNILIIKDYINMLRAWFWEMKGEAKRGMIQSEGRKWRNNQRNQTVFVAYLFLTLFIFIPYLFRFCSIRMSAFCCLC